MASHSSPTRPSPTRGRSRPGPALPTHVLAARRDRLIPYDFQCELSRERLGVEPDAIDCGHLPALARPDELTAWIRATAP